MFTEIIRRLKGLWIQWIKEERGITIKAKNTAIHWKDYIINIVDTLVMRILGEKRESNEMVDGVLLIVDAAGTQAQTRFVLRKALAQV